MWCKYDKVLYDLNQKFKSRIEVRTEPTATTTTAFFRHQADKCCCSGMFLHQTETQVFSISFSKEEDWSTALKQSSVTCQNLQVPPKKAPGALQ